MDNSDRQSLLDMGIMLLEKENYEKALEIFSQIITWDYDNLDAYFYRAYVLNRMNRHQEAMVDLNHLLAKDSEYSDAYFERAIAFLRMNNYPSAVDDFSTVIEMNPEHVGAHYNRAMANIQGGKPRMATGDLTRCLEAEPENQALYMLRGKTYLSVNIIDRAINDFTIVLELNPGNVEAYLLRASAQESLGDLNAALRDYTMAVKNAPESPACRLSLGNIWLKKNDEEKARVQFWKALELEPSGSVPWQVLPILTALEEDLSVLVEPIINLALGSQASSITFTRGGGYLFVSIEVLNLRMPLMNIPLEASPGIYRKIAQFCNVEPGSTKGSFHYAFKGNKYYFEMEHVGDSEKSHLTLRVLYKSFMEKFGFAYKNGPVAVVEEDSPTTGERQIETTADESALSRDSKKEDKEPQTE